jgi:hypothetical protein
MGILNNALGINLTDEDPLIVSPFNESPFMSYVVPPPPASYMITETGIFMLTEDGINLMITE